jgi:predicted permease
LVVSQVTGSLLLLIGAGLFLRSWERTLSADLGFGQRPTALLSVLSPAVRFTPAESREYARRLLDRFRELPGVEAVGFINDLPLDLSNNWTDFLVEGHTPPPGQDAFRAQQARVDGGFFDAAGISIVQGRTFSDADGPETEAVAIVSEAMARRYWPDGDAVGRLVRRTPADEPDVRVVGVATDIKVRSLGEAPRDMVYVPYTQTPAGLLNFVARTSADPAETVRLLVAAAREVDPDVVVVDAKTLTQHLAFARLPARLGALLLSAFGGLALALAAIGVFGLVRYSVATRTREVGIRVALGADADALVRMLARDGVRLVVVGSGIGLGLSLLVTRLVGGLLFGIGTVDPVTFVAAPLLLGAVALLAAYLPARRASRVDPIKVLRAD